jgi:hypothetical protein
MLSLSRLLRFCARLEDLGILSLLLYFPRHIHHVPLLFANLSNCCRREKAEGEGLVPLLHDACGRAQICQCQRGRENHVGVMGQMQAGVRLEAAGKGGNARQTQLLPIGMGCASDTHCWSVRPL